MSDESSAAPPHDAPARAKQAAAPLRKVAKWLFALLVASLVIPAITTQWSDRQKELTLKDSLVSRLTSASTVATDDAGALVTDESFPFKKAPDQSWRRRAFAISRQWKVTAYTLESELAAYFPHSHIWPDFRTFNDRVQDFIYLAFDDCPDGRASHLGELKSYLPGLKQSDWTHLEEGSTIAGDACWRRTNDFRETYVTRLAGELLSKQEDLVRTITHAHASGFNDGFGDFLHQILPFY